MGVVCTEEVEIHPSGDIAPCIEGRIWDDRDVEGHRLMTQAVHAHGALAGIELTHAGLDAANQFSHPRRSVRAARECSAGPGSSRPRPAR